MAPIRCPRCRQRFEAITTERLRDGKVVVTLRCACKRDDDTPAVQTSIESLARPDRDVQTF